MVQRMPMPVNRNSVYKQREGMVLPRKKSLPLPHTASNLTWDQKTKEAFVKELVPWEKKLQKADRGAIKGTLGVPKSCGVGAKSHVGK